MDQWRPHISSIFSNLHFKSRFSNKICVLSVPGFAKIKFEMLVSSAWKINGDISNKLYFDDFYGYPAPWVKMRKNAGVSKNDHVINDFFLIKLAV